MKKLLLVLALGLAPVAYANDEVPAQEETTTQADATAETTSCCTKVKDFFVNTGKTINGKWYGRSSVVAAALATIYGGVAVYNKAIKSENVFADTNAVFAKPVTKTVQWYQNREYTKAISATLGLAVVADVVAGYIVEGNVQPYCLSKGYNFVSGLFKKAA